jgi:hypothetical protein
MKKLLLAAGMFATLSLAAQDLVIDDANAKRRSLSGSFQSIRVSDGIELLLTQGSEESVAVSASESKYLERLKTEVSDGVLRIYYDNKSMVWNNNERRRLKAYVSFKTLNQIKASSGAEVQAKSVWKLDALQLDFSSGARFNGSLEVNELATSQGSGSEINLSGKAASLKAEASSGAVFKGYDLAAGFCEAKASSGGEVRITVNKELAAKASSGGSIRYRGDGVLRDINVSSGGSVKRS